MRRDRSEAGISDPPPRTRTGAGDLPRFALALAAILCALHLIVPLASIGRQVSLNYNEGWNAYHAASVASPRPLYPADGTLFPNNYPPLSFYLMAGLSPFFGDSILVGRVVSAISFLVTALGIGLVIALMTGSASLAVFAGLLFAAIIGSSFVAYAGVNAPQFLAHALMMIGLVLLVRRRTLGWIAGAALLVILGGLVKHSLIALPLAVTIWLWRCDRSALWRWLAVSLVLAGGAAACLLLLHGAPLVEGLTAPRSYDLLRSASTTQAWLGRLQVPLAVALVGCLGVARNPHGLLLLLYAGIALAVGIFSGGGAGVNHNIFFDLVIALSMLASYVLWQVERISPPRWVAPARGTLALALCLGPLLAAPGVLLRLSANFEQLREKEAATIGDVRYLSADPGPALCESLALCFWAGKAPEVDFFGSRQAFRRGAAGEERLLDRLRRREFGVVQLDSPNRPDAERVSSRFVGVLDQNYRAHRRSANGVFFRPR